MSRVRTRSMAAAEYAASRRFNKTHSSSSVTVIIVNNQHRCKMNNNSNRYRNRNRNPRNAVAADSKTLSPMSGPSVKRDTHITDHSTDIISDSFANLSREIEGSDQMQQQQQQCSTPRSKEYRIPDSHLCPPAPRKKRPSFYGVSSARSSSVLSSAFFIVPDFNVLLASTTVPDNRSIGSSSNSATSQ